jgi:hypothetical protein
MFMELELCDKKNISLNPWILCELMGKSEDKQGQPVQETKHFQNL